MRKVVVFLFSMRNGLKEKMKIDHLQNTYSCAIV